MSNTATLRPGEENAHCRNCKFWDFNSYKETDETGICRRRSPVPSLGKSEKQDDGSQVAFFVWPMTYANDWCGDWVWDEFADETEKEPS